MTEEDAFIAKLKIKAYDCEMTGACFLDQGAIVPYSNK
jgi:hypothetical protein